MGFFKKMFSDAVDELKKSIEDSKNEMRKSLEDMKCSAMAEFSSRTSSRIVDEDDDDDAEPRISIGRLEDGVLTISEGFSELDDESLEEYKRLRKIVFPASLKKLESNVVCDQEKLEAVDFSKVTQLEEIPDDFVSGETRIKEFVIPQGVTTVGDGFLGECGAGTKVFVPASVKCLGYINGNNDNDQYVYLFAPNLDLSHVEEDINTLYVLPDYYSYYAKQLKECDSEACLREMPEDMMNFYKTSKSEAQEIVSKPAEDEDEEMEIETVPNDNESAEEEVAPEIKPASQAELTGEGGLFSARLEAMISAALQDGVLTDKERELLKKRVEKEGEDWDEVEMIIEARLAEMKPAAPAVQIPQKDLKVAVKKSPQNPKMLKIPEGVKVIKKRDYSCSEFEEILFPSSLETIDTDAFFYENLKTIDLSNCSQLKTIGSQAFGACSKLKQIDFSRCSSLQEIEDKAFYDCTNLESVIFPSSLEKIGSQAFGACSKLKQIDFSRCSSLQEIEDAAFWGCTIESVIFPSSLEKIGSQAFCECSKLKQIDFSRCSSLQEIEDEAFYNCTKLEEIALPDSITIIGDQTFYGCSKLRKVVMPSSLEKLGDAIFVECDSLEEVDYSKVTKLTTIPERFETGNDEQMEIPMGVTTIRKDAFMCCCWNALFLPPTLKDYKDTNGNWSFVYLFAPPLAKMDNLFENCENLYVLPQYLEKYKSIHKALGKYSWCEIHTMPDEYLYFYDN